MPIVLLLNLKGGVAKTTNAVALAETYAARGRRVLLIDADHQLTASELLIGRKRLEQAETSKQTLHDMLAAMLKNGFAQDDVERFVHPQASYIEEAKPSLFCIPCSYRIDEFSTNMAKARQGYHSNQEFLNRLSRMRHLFSNYCDENFDFTLVDCPPTLSLQVQFLLGCSQYYIVPTIPDPLSLRGSLHLIQRLRMKGFKKIQALGMLWSLVRKQVPIHNKLIDAVRSRIDDYRTLPKPFRAYIPNMSAMADAMSFQRPYQTLNQKYRNKCSQLFQFLGKEIEERMGG